MAIRSRFTKGPWTATQISIRGARVWAVAAPGHGRIAVVYGGERDARLMAASPKLCRYVEKHAHAGDTEAQALINEL